MDDALIKLVSVEVPEAVIIRAEMPRYPVQYDSDPFLMECFDEMLESVR
jgi:hypothetical protein